MKQITDYDILEACFNKYGHEPNDTERYAFNHGAKWMQEQLKNQWVSVEDRLPDEGWYLIKWEQGSVHISFFTGIVFIDPGISHWMPLPEQPISTNP